MVETIYCEILPPGNQYSPGVYAFHDKKADLGWITLSHYVWAEDSIRGVWWLKNPDRDIEYGLSRLTPEEEKQFMLAKLRAKYI